MVLVSDVDLLSPAIFQLREKAEIPELGIRIDLDNVSFVLNALDSLAGDNHGFWAIRSHRPTYRTLTQMEKRTEASTEKAAKQRKKFYDDCDKAIQDAQEAVDRRVEEIEKNSEGNSTEAIQALGIAVAEGQRKVEAATQKCQKDRDKAVRITMRDYHREVRQVENQVKWLAILLPFIPPLMLGLVVFAGHRAREREGVSQKRLR